MSETAEYHYDPSCFLSPRNLQQAKDIILTANDTTTERRWEVETPYFADIICENICLGPISRVLDYGCGVGRISKELIKRSGCRAFGVDISPAMRALAAGYAESPLFLACAPEMMVDLPPMDAIILVWVMQHIPDPETTLLRLIGTLRLGGRVFVANSYAQCLPISGNKWLEPDDDPDVLGLFRKHMKQVEFSPTFDAEKTSPRLAKHGWWGVFERREIP